MLQPGKKHSPSDTTEERYGLKLRSNLKRDLEMFASGFDIDVSDIIRSGAQLYTNGYLPVLGKIPCGPLAEAIADTHYHEVVPPYLKPNLSLGDFLLEAAGDSMSPKIERGDLVMLRPDIESADGEICAVQIYRDGAETCEATLKRLFRDYTSRKWILRPINPDHPEVEIEWEGNKLEVIGVYRGHITKGQ